MRLGNFYALVSEGTKRKKIPEKLRISIWLASIPVVAYHIYSSILTSPHDVIFRSNHVVIFLVLIFLLYSPWSKGDKGVSKWDIFLIALTLATYVYLQFIMDRVIFHWAFADPVYLWDVIFGGIFILLVLEASRRVMGLSLTFIVLALIAYAFIGPWIPGIFGHRGFTIAQVVEVNFLTTSGIFSLTTKVSSSVAFIFIIFGAFLKITGGGDFFFDLGSKVAGHSRGGIAKTAVIASSFFGSLSGSPIANAASIGTVTIPMMRRAGYPAVFAASIEAAASCGGPIMPPVMGAAVFIMAEIIGLSYFNIIVAAAIPALIYYACIFIQADSEAIRLGLKGIPRSEMKPLAKLWPGFIQYFLPLLWLVWRLYTGYTPARAGMETALILMVFTWIKQRGKMSLKEAIDALDDAVRTTIPVVVACSAGGIIIGIISLTGVAAKFTNLIMGMGEGGVFISLLLTMAVSLILGLPLNITPVYILTAALAGPALVKVGLPVLSVHLFLIYYAAMGSLTPPVALTAFTAAGIAGANVMEVSWRAWRLGLSAFVVPFAFIYRPAMLHFNDLPATLEAVVFVSFAVYALIAGMDGFLIGLRSKLARAVLIILFLLLMIPMPGLNLAALVVLLAMIIRGRRSKPGAGLKIEGRELGGGI